MEGVLRGKEILGLKKAACSYDNPCFYFPIRHHSPVCSFHLKKVIEEYAPDCILIEGPDNANDLLEELVLAGTQAPFAIYYSYHDEKGLVNDKKEHYRCYYPFLDYSPELVALRMAKKKEIDRAFIDLPYEEILIAGQEKESYNDDHYLAQNRFIQRLLEKSDMRSFEEFWEKYFEIEGLTQTEDLFLEHMLLYCVLSRANTSLNELEEEGCLEREAYMREKIAAAKKKYQRVLVVTGGFHVAGLVENDWLSANREDAGKEAGQATVEKEGTDAEVCPTVTPWERKSGSGKGRGTSAWSERSGKGKQLFTEKVPESLTYRKKTEKLHKTAQKDKGVYLMSYSMEAADRLNGYASGMPHPMFYQRIWERIVAQENKTSVTSVNVENIVQRTAGMGEIQGQKDSDWKAEYGVRAETKQDIDGGNADARTGRLKEIYEQTNLRFLVEVGKQVRKKEGYPSAFDEICALAMCRNLAALRGKKSAGVYELTDSVLSNYVKGEYNLATDKPMRELGKALTGKRIGKLADGTKLPPLCRDFEALTHTYRLDAHSSAKKEVTLQIFATQKHREMSCFFYRMEFLQTGFAVRKKGPDLRRKKDRNLIREIWEYRFGEGVMSALVEASVYGGTLAEACRTIAHKKLMEETDAGEVSALLIRLFEMGLAYDSKEGAKRLEKVIRTDSNFFALAATFSNLTMLSDLSGLYQTTFGMEDLKEIVTQKLLTLLIHMTTVREEETQKLLETLKELYRVLLAGGHEEERGYFIDVLRKMKQAPDINASIAGAIQGILYAYGEMETGQIALCMKGYLQGTQEKALWAADYVRGLFFMARDILFADESILDMLDVFVRETSYENFLNLLPQLRLAFSYFTPVEMDRLAAKVAGKYGMTKKDFTRLHEVSKEEYEYGKMLEEKVLKHMGMTNIFCGS
ncbi:MAG: hypothetical protein E7294_10210 [Lachnospiraceae bacterium]|nr:hypothetical protein [Lachnospiraceae bacterium]